MPDNQDGTEKKEGTNGKEVPDEEAEAHAAPMGLQRLYPDPAAIGPKPVFLGITIDNLHTYFMIFVGFAGAAAIILFLLSFRLRKMMHGVN